MAIDDYGVEGMYEKSFVGIERHIELAAEFLNFAKRSGQEVPGAGIRLPCICVTGERFGLIVDWVDDDGQQDEIAAKAVGKAFLQEAEIIG